MARGFYFLHAIPRMGLLFEITVLCIVSSCTFIILFFSIYGNKDELFSILKKYFDSQSSTYLQNVVSVLVSLVLPLISTCFYLQVFEIGWDNFNIIHMCVNNAVFMYIVQYVTSFCQCNLCLANFFSRILPAANPVSRIGLQSVFLRIFSSSRRFALFDVPFIFDTFWVKFWILNFASVFRIRIRSDL